MYKRKVNIRKAKKHVACKELWVLATDLKVGDVVKIKPINLGSRYEGLDALEGMCAQAGLISFIESVSPSGNVKIFDSEYFYSPTMLLKRGAK